ncbi:MAG TPA: DivIVA domain-containing protein, partial [Actinomycetospora sp.]|uniref:DivIVA domain-containing protein n=1 Tax=Actinomycetospora sp. TaxID=1872135 RepID=UPI002F416BEC
GGTAGGASVPAPRTAEPATLDARSWWGAGFTVTRRGYDTGEVEAAFDRAAADYAVLVADRDELARGELRAREQIAELQRELRELHAAPIDGENLSARLRHMLQLAQEEATEVRAHAHTTATAAVEAARTQARAIHDDAVAWARKTREETDGTNHRRLADASEQATAIVVEAERQAAKLQREAEDARAEAARRAEASEAHAREVTAAVEAEVARLEQDAELERTRLDEASQARRAQAERDFETALAARRKEADAAREAAEKDRRDAEAADRAAHEAATARLAATKATTAELEAHQREMGSRFAAVRELIERASASLPAPAATE